MKWTKKKPDREGWWWYKGKFSKKISAKVVKQWMVSRKKVYINCFNGYWSDTPIEEPEGE